MNQQIDNKFIKFTFIVLTLIVFTKTVSLVMYIYLPKNGTEVQISTSQAKNISSQSIVNPFKISQKKEQISQKIDVTTQISNLKLVAIYKENDKGFAIILDGAITHLIKQGESYKNYKLSEINQNSIYLINNNKKYILEFLEEKFVSDTKQNTEQKNIAQVPTNLEQNFFVKIKRDDFNEHITDLNSVKQNILFKEVMKDGKITGFRVLSVNRNSYFKNMGLLPGDIIKTFNGIDLDNYIKVLEIYNNVNSYTNIKLEIIRNNITKELNYEIF